MKEFIIFVCTDSTEIFSKLRSAGLNYNLPSFFTDLTVRGVSNKHCLLTFFIENIFFDYSMLTFFISKCCLLITFANSSDPNQARQTI